MLAVAFVLILLLVTVLAARAHLRAISLIIGLRADVNRLASEFARVATEREQLDKAVQGAIGAAHQRITNTHGVAATALDRILYYTKVSKPLGRLGQAYDRAIAKIKAKAEAEATAAAEANADVAAPVPPVVDDLELPPADEGEQAEQHEQAERDEQDAAFEGSAQIVGSIGTACG